MSNDKQDERIPKFSLEAIRRMSDSERQALRVRIGEALQVASASGAPHKMASDEVDELLNRLHMLGDPTVVPDVTKHMFPKIGEFIYFFSQIELALRDILANAIDLPDGLLYPVTASYDFDKLCNVALAAFRKRCTHPPTVARFEHLISDCKNVVNHDRNRIVHGTWWPRVA